MSWLTSDTLNNIKADSMKFGIASAAERFGDQQGSLASSKLFDVAWLKSSVLTLVGLAVYQLTLRKLVKTDSIESLNLRNALDNILKFGTMLIASRFLDNRSLADLRDADWQKTSASMLAGFAVYDIGITQVFNANKLGLSPRATLAVDDVARFSTVFSVQNFLLGGSFNMDFLLSKGGFIAGLVLYDLLIADVKPSNNLIV